MALFEQEILFYPDAKGAGWKIKVGDSFYQLNNDTKTILSALVNNDDYQQATIQYNNDTESNLSAEEFRALAGNVKELIQDEVTPTAKKKKSFLAIEFVLLNRSLTNRIPGFLKAMFLPVFFWCSFFLLLTFNLWIAFSHNSSGDYHFSTISILSLGAFLIFIHELGHIAACKRFAGEVGEMGAGIYIIFPILYSNISPIWRSSVKEKVITNLAGVYIQLWCLALFYGIYLITNNQLLYFFAIVMPLPILAQLYPFVRSDGYWLLADITNIPNLLQKSRDAMAEFMQSPSTFLKKKEEGKRKLIFLLLYGIANYAIILYFVYHELKFNWDDIVGAPKMVWDIFVSLFNSKKSAFHFEPHIISTIIFYILAYKYVKSFFTFLVEKSTKSKNFK